MKIDSNFNNGSSSGRKQLTHLRDTEKVISSFKSRKVVSETEIPEEMETFSCEVG